MKSPFPGMDPFIEASGRWEDFHTKFIGEIERTLSPLLPARYAVSLAERSYVVLANPHGKDEKTILPDVGVNLPASPHRPAPRTGSAAVAEPITDAEAVPIRAFVATEYREVFIEIYDVLEEQRLVTCIEVLSPSNKRPGTPGWDLYQRKRQALLLGQAHFVEIDLVREGGRLPMLDPWPDSPYGILVVWRELAPAGRAWPGDFRRPLPSIPIPLANPDPDVRLALQPILEAVYERSRYSQRINYTQAVRPPLSADESAWLADKLRLAAAPTEPPPKSRRGPRRRN